MQVRFGRLLGVLHAVAAPRWMVACGDRHLLPHLVAEAAAVTIRLVATRPGPEAADRRLLAELANAVPASARRIVIASGDHIFAEPARRLAATGRRVLVVGPAGGIARQLAAAVESTVARTAACRLATGELRRAGGLAGHH